MATVRIQKALSDAGILSRRQTESYIRAGRIKVDGHPATLGHPVDIRKQVITIDGEKVVFAHKKESRYIALYKPRGFVTTTSDEKGRRCITDLVKDVGTRVYPIGRLDMASEGLILLTNDGSFANLVMHPSHQIGKTYRVTVRPGPKDEHLVALSSGVKLPDGTTTQPCIIDVLDNTNEKGIMRMTIHEGKNRQIRRMCEAVGLTVVRLRRISIGPVKLGMLQPGEWRELTPAEIKAIRNAAAVPQQDTEKKKYKRK